VRERVEQREKKLSVAAEKGAAHGPRRASISAVAVVFVALIALLAAGTLKDAAKPMAKEALKVGERRSGVISRINKAFEDDIAMRSRFIEGFGLVQRLMDKHEVDNYDIIKDREGYLHRAGEDMSGRAAAYAENASALYEYARRGGRDFLLIETPSTDIRGVTHMPPGVDYYDNNNIDLFLAGLAGKGVPTIDVRELSVGMREDELRYKTDHHWAIPLVLKTFGAMIDYLNDKYGYDLDPGGVFADPDNYYVEKYDDAFLGSIGIRVGKYYAGMDDLDIYLPAFDTDLTFRRFADGHEPDGVFTGDFREAFIDDELLRPGNMNKYRAFLRNSYVESVIENHRNSGGLKCLFITDSFGRPYTQYLSLLFSETASIDVSLDRYTGSVREYIDSYDPDVVICMVSGHSVWHIMPDFEGA
jgi:hypothetical protein